MKKFLLIAIILGLTAMLAACSNPPKESDSKTKADAKGSKWDRKSAAQEYRLLQTELKMAETKKLYLVIDLRRMELEFRLKGATVWTQPIEMVEPDSGKLVEFAKRFEGDNGQFMRNIDNKYLFAADNKTPDSVLAIVGQAVNINPSLLQRDVPARFQLSWEGGLVLDIRTDITAKPKAKLKNVLLEVGQAIKSPFGEITLEIKTNPEGALTLYRATKRGLPTVIYPPRF
jgi:hypothetical protein